MTTLLKTKELSDEFKQLTINKLISMHIKKTNKPNTIGNKIFLLNLIATNKID